MGFLISLYLSFTAPIYYEKPEFIQIPTIITAEVTGYTASMEETDENPFINAGGRTPRKGDIACPSRLRFGTRIKINGLMYICWDRMASRYREGNHFDIFFGEGERAKEEALKFGRQKLIVEIYQ